MARTSLSIAPEVLQKLRIRAARNGRSVSAEVAAAIETKPSIEERLDSITQQLEQLISISERNQNGTA